MTDFILRNRQSEKNQWKDILCSGIQNWNPKPNKVEFLVGGGIFIIISSSDERLIAELLHKDENKYGFQQIDACVVRYVGNELTTAAEIWLQKLCVNIEQIPAAQKKDWNAYLLWASRQLKRSFANPSDKLLTQGNELLIRLLEPCQARCSFCICRSAQPDLISSAEDIEERMLEGIQKGYRSIVFTGGEPTLVKDLPNVIRRAKELGYRKRGLQSNGIKLADMTYTKNLVDAGLNYVLQSFHSHEAKIHEGIFQLSGCFPKCVQSVKNLMALHINVTLNYVTTQKNVCGHQDFVEFVYQNFRVPRGFLSSLRRQFPAITFSSMSPQGWGERNTEDLPRLSAVAQSVQGALRLAQRYHITVRIPGLCGFPACFLPQFAHVFDELTENEVVDIDERQYFEQCHECVFRHKCSGYWKGYVQKYGTSEFIPAKASDGYQIPKKPFRLVAFMEELGIS